MGVNSRKLGDPVIPHKDKRLPNYEANQHFDDVAKICHDLIQDLKEVPKLTKKPKPTSNNLNLDILAGKGKKYMVPTKQDLRKSPTLWVLFTGR